MIYNLTQCYVPVYVSESMNYPTKYVGFVPLVLYMAGCIYSAVVTPMVDCFGKKASSNLKKIKLEKKIKIKKNKKLKLKKKQIKKKIKFSVLGSICVHRGAGCRQFDLV